MTESIVLSQLPIGEHMTVLRVGGAESMRRRLEDLGVVEGTDITCLMASPLGDPRAYQIRGAVIALRREDAAAVVGRLSANAGSEGREP